MDAVFVGIDVSKDQLDVAVHPAGEPFVVARNPQGLRDLVARLAPLAPATIALEATGGYETIVTASLAAAGLPVVVVNPAQIRAFANAINQRAKTDPLDARLIARFVAATRPPLRPLPDAQTQHLGELLVRRGQIIEMIGAERQRRQRLTERQTGRSVERLLVALNKELAKLDRHIDAAVRASPAWRAKEDLLVSVPGVGRIIARTLLAELPELGTLDRRRIAALAGLAPWTRRSGRWKGQSRIGGGRARARAALFMGAMVGARHNPVLKAFRDHLVADGKPRLAALLAAAHKLLTILNAILRDGVPWRQPEHA